MFGGESLSKRHGRWELDCSVDRRQTAELLSDLNEVFAKHNFRGLNGSDGQRRWAGLSKGGSSNDGVDGRSHFFVVCRVASGGTKSGTCSTFGGLGRVFGFCARSDQKV